MKSREISVTSPAAAVRCTADAMVRRSPLVASGFLAKEVQHDDDGPAPGPFDEQKRHVSIEPTSPVPVKALRARWSPAYPCRVLEQPLRVMQRIGGGSNVFSSPIFELGAVSRVMSDLKCTDGSWVEIRCAGGRRKAVGKIFCVDASSFDEEDDERVVLVPPSISFHIGADVYTSSLSSSSGDIASLPRVVVRRHHFYRETVSSSSKSSASSLSAAIAASGIPVAEEVSLQRVMSPLADPYANYTDAIGRYFSSPHVLSRGQVIGIPLSANTWLNLRAKSRRNQTGVSAPACVARSRLLSEWSPPDFSPIRSTAPTSSHVVDMASTTEHDPPDAHRSPITPPAGVKLVYFKVTGISPRREKYVRVHPESSRLSLQLGSCRSRVPYSLDTYLSRTWNGHPLWMIPAVDQEHSDAADKSYERLLSLCRPCMSLQASQIGIMSSVLLGGPRRSGKRVLVARIARELGVHLLEENAYKLLGSTEKQTGVNFLDLIARAADYAPCIVHVRRISAFVDQSKAHQRGTKLEAAAFIKKIIAKLRHPRPSSEHPVLFVASTTSLPQLPGVLRACFTHEVDVSAPISEEREGVLQDALRAIPRHVPTPMDGPPDPDALEVSPHALASKTAGLVGGELRLLIDDAGVLGLQRMLKDEEKLRRSGGSPSLPRILSSTSSAFTSPVATPKHAPTSLPRPQKHSSLNGKKNGGAVEEHTQKAKKVALASVDEALSKMNEEFYAAVTSISSSSASQPPPLARKGSTSSTNRDLLSPAAKHPSISSAYTHSHSYAPSSSSQSYPGPAAAAAVGPGSAVNSLPSSRSSSPFEGEMMSPRSSSSSRKRHHRRRSLRRGRHSRRHGGLNLSVEPSLIPEDFENALDQTSTRVSRTSGTLAQIPNVRWADVGGLEHVKREVLDTIELPLNYPEKFAKGVRQRSGMLLFGPPGTGKTLVAKCVATECSLNFISVKGPELLNMYVGESEANVRQIFETARRAKPAVLFFDELDSLAPRRGQGSDSGNVMDRVVSMLLAELDGMTKTSDVFVIGATNRPDLLDPNILRPGRLDQCLYLGVSSTKDEQLKIFNALTRKFTLSKGFEPREVVESIPFNFTGADFYALCSDALLLAMKRKVDEVQAMVDAQNRDICAPYMIADSAVGEGPIAAVDGASLTLEKEAVAYEPASESVAAASKGNVSESDASPPTRVPNGLEHGVGGLKAAELEGLKAAELEGLKATELAKKVALANRNSHADAPPLANGVNGTHLLSEAAEAASIDEKSRVDALSPSLSNGHDGPDAAAPSAKSVPIEEESQLKRNDVAVAAAAASLEEAAPSSLEEAVPSSLEEAVPSSPGGASAIDVDVGLASDVALMSEEKYSDDEREHELERESPPVPVAAAAATVDYSSVALPPHVRLVTPKALLAKMSAEELKIVVAESDFRDAVAKLTPSLTVEDLVKYEKLREKFSVRK